MFSGSGQFEKAPDRINTHPRMFFHSGLFEQLNSRARSPGTTWEPCIYRGCQGCRAIARRRWNVICVLRNPASTAHTLIYRQSEWHARFGLREVHVAAQLDESPFLLGTLYWGGCETCIFTNVPALIKGNSHIRR